MSTELEILKSLESEAIEIFRETAATFRKPVLMYSIVSDLGLLSQHRFLIVGILLCTSTVGSCILMRSLLAFLSSPILLISFILLLFRQCGLL